jgi:hypothetical protein
VKKLAVYMMYSVCTALLRGFVIKMLWSWFAVTTFNMKPLNIFQAYGLGLLITSMIPMPYIGEGDDKRSTDLALANFVWTILLLLFGYLVHFMI